MSKATWIRWELVACLTVMAAGCAAEVIDETTVGASDAEVSSVAAELSNQLVTTYSDFGFPSGVADSREITLGVLVDPGKGAARFFAHQFHFQNGTGYIGLQTDATRPDGSSGKVAIFSIWDATAASIGDAGAWQTPFGGEGVGWSLRMPYEWRAGRSYRLLVKRLASGAWGGYVKDLTSGVQSYLGSIVAPAAAGRLQGSSVAFTEYYGPDFAACSNLRLSRVSWSKPIAQPGGVVASSVSNSVGGGACASSRKSTGIGPTIHALGWAQVLYVGDSLAAETIDTISGALGATGRATLSNSAFPGMAVCDFLENSPPDKAAAMPEAARLRAKVRATKPHLVALQFWGNGFTPCIKDQGFASEAYYTQHFWNAFSAAQEIERGAQEAGIARPKIVWVMQGPQHSATPLPAGTKSRPERLNDIYRYVASYYGDFVSDAGWDVSLAANYDGNPANRYVWTQYLPCTTVERNTPGLCTHPLAYGGVTQIHKANDTVHFCLGDESTWDKFFTCGKTTLSPGIVRYGSRIAGDVKLSLGL